jgi:hypothetical protein
MKSTWDPHGCTWSPHGASTCEEGPALVAEADRPALLAAVAHHDRAVGQLHALLERQGRAALGHPVRVILQVPHDAHRKVVQHAGVFRRQEARAEVPDTSTASRPH